MEEITTLIQRLHKPLVLEMWTQEEHCEHPLGSCKLFDSSEQPDQAPWDRTHASPGHAGVC